jgi:hypothetical protein
VLVSGRVPAFLVASVGVGVLMAVLASPHVAAQTVRGLPGMRATIDAESDEARARQGKQAKKAKKADSAPIGQIPTFSTPAASGAGKTGFVSITAPRRKSKAGAQPPGAGARAQDKPMTASATGPAPGADQAPPGTTARQAAKKQPQPKAAPKAVATKRVTAPKAPALMARQDFKEQLNTLPNTVVAVPRPVEVDQFAPVGIRAGTFLLRPAIETIGGYDNNPGRVQNGPGSAFGAVAGELVARSDWQRHELRANIRGSYTAYEALPQYDRPDFETIVDGRVDVTDRTRLDVQGRYHLFTDNPGSPNLQAGLAKLPLANAFGGSVGIGQRFNRLDVALKGSIDRTEYGESQLTDGTTASNAGRNFNQYSSQLRTSYELTPGFKPFAQLDVDTRIYDLPIDAGGVPRDSDGIAGRAGTSFEFSPALVGEVALGYLLRVYKDPLLPDVSGLIVDGSLVWRPTGLTTARLIAATTTAESTLVGVSGVFTRTFGLQVDHAFRRWLIGTAKVGYAIDDYVGSNRLDHRYTASLGILYTLSRSWQVKGEVRQDWLKSNVSGADYTASIASVGLRWQP